MVRHDAERTKECMAAISARLRRIERTDRRRIEDGSASVSREPPRLPGRPLHFSARLLAARLGLVALDAAAVRGADSFQHQQAEVARLQALDALVAFKDPKLIDTLDPLWAGGDVRFLAKVLAVLGPGRGPKARGPIAREVSATRAGVAAAGD